MKHPFSILLLLFLTLSGSAQTDYTGHYSVLLSGGPSWQYHGMVVRTFGDSVEGTFSLDLGIGPEARAPKPHETVHLADFRAGYEGEEITFEIEVAGTQYAFQLYPVADAGKPYFTGFVTIVSGEQTRTEGVLAVKNAEYTGN